MGWVFEDICRQYLWRENIAELLPFFFQKLGRWWGNDPLRRTESEIDIVALGEKDHALFGECKWQNEKIGVDVLNLLREKARHFHFEHKYYYVFSKSGFTASCENAAKEMSNVRLVPFISMFQR
jgi:AAA+ ATPase superfamily predicted ATPase